MAFIEQKVEHEGICMYISRINVQNALNEMKYALKLKICSENTESFVKKYGYQPKHLLNPRKCDCMHGKE